jgi:broad specificity phosphatase PhoE
VSLFAASLLLAGLTLGAPPAPPAPRASTIVVVRHAEKAADPEKTGDPPLTPAGEKRAQALADALRSLPVRAIFSTPFKRTSATAAPLAAAKKLEVQRYEAGQEAALATRLGKEHAGETVVVVAHSDTIPALVEALGGAPRPSLTLTDYDGLFVVVRGPDGTVTLVPLHYGAPNPG